MPEPSIQNAYQIPASRLAPEAPDAPTLVRVPAGNGLTWIGDAWRLFRLEPGLLVGLSLLQWVISTGMGSVPFLGQLASAVLSPTLLAGFFLAVWKLDRGERASVDDLFAGFRLRFGPLLVVGLIFLGICLALLLLGAAVVAIGIGLGLENVSQHPGLLMAVVLLVCLALMLILMALFTMNYATVLVMLSHCEPGAAYRLAFRAFMVNVLPFLVFGLASSLLYLLGLLPLLLGLLIVSPWMTIAIYTGMKDLFPNLDLHTA